MVTPENPKPSGRRPLTVMFLETSLRMGGTENVVTQLIERFDPKRIRSVLCCLYNSGVLGERLIKKGFAVHHGLAKHRWDLGLGMRLFRLLRQEKVDVLFIINQPLTQFWGTACAVLAGVPVRITAIRSTGKINRIQRRLWINDFTFPWITRVTALSQMHKSYLVEREHINARKIEIIPNGVDLARFSRNGTPASLRSSLGLPEGSPVVGIVAMLRPEKAHDVFLKAAGEVLREVPKTHFLIVGDGEERPRLEAMAKELAIDSHVHFMGARSDVPRLLSLMDVGVLSSHPVVETLSNAVLEYMAAAKPVVATRVGSLPEQVEEGKTGFLIEAGDSKALAGKIIRLLQDPALAQQMGAAGRKRVEDCFTLEQMVHQTGALFERLLLEQKGKY